MNKLNYFSEKEIKLLSDAKTKKEYVHLKSTPSKFQEIMNLKKMNSLISLHNYWNQNNFNMVLDKKPIHFNQYSTKGLNIGFSNIAPDPVKVQNLIKKGASLVLNDIIYLSNKVKDFSNDLQNITFGKCQANLYFSMQSHQAFGPHYDTHDVFALHCDGEKTWNIYETLEQDPINHPLFKLDVDERIKKAGKVVDQIHMKAGDLLYLPRGKYHDALASQSGAIHIAFGIVYMKPIDIIHLLWDRVIVNPYLRSDLRDIKSGDDFLKINEKISDQLKSIFDDKSLADLLYEQYENWPYKFVNYDLDKLVSAGVQYEISNSVKIELKNAQKVLTNGKNIVPIPKEFIEMTEFCFKRSQISIKNLKDNFPNILQKDIDKFFLSMKNMKIFV